MGIGLSVVAGDIWKADGAPEAGVLATLEKGAQDDAGPSEDDARGLGGAQAELSTK